VAIIGGGLQGCCVALELARRGVPVDLFESRSRIMDGASRHNEGKIHLGYTFAAEGSLATASQLARSAVAFFPLLRGWLGPSFDRLPVSDVFTYGVHEASQWSAADLCDRYEAISAEVLSAMKNSGGDYFGEADPEAVSFVASQRLNGDTASSITHTFKTAERALDPLPFADLVAAVTSGSPLICVSQGAHVTRVGGATGQYRIELPDDARADYRAVVNASWNGRLTLDSQMGLAPQSAWNFRVKYFMRVDGGLAEVLPTLTAVLGPFGDVVQYPTGAAYLSWYPAGRTVFSTDLEPSSHHPLDAGATAELSERIVTGLAGLVPAVRSALASEVRRRLLWGHIFGSGDTDIDDPASLLHRRSAEIISDGQYHSVNPGKLGCAPLLAVDVANRILAA
jgi:hypothetical protein